MTLAVKDASGTTQTIKTNDDMAGVAGTPNANVLSVQGTSGGTALPVTVTNVPATQAVSGAVTVSNLPATQAISAAALPLPAGGATDASLGTIGTTPPALPGASTGIMGLLRWMGSLFASLITTSLGTASRVVIVDPATGNGSLVQAFHNADNQIVGATSYGLLTGGVDQLINASGNLDRKRGVAGDAMAVTGLAAEVPMLWNGATYDRAVNGGGDAAKAQRTVPANAAPTNRSGTITAANTAQVLMAANTIRKGFRIQNQSTGDLWVNDMGAAATVGQPSLQIKPGAYLASEMWGCSPTAVSIIGSTTGQAFHASEA